MNQITKTFLTACFTISMGIFVLLQSGCTHTFNFRMEYDKGLRSYNEKDYESAIVSLTNALNYNPDSYSTYCLLGTSYAYKGDDKNAERVLTEGAKAFPDRWNAYIFLGDLKRSKHDYVQAVTYYEKAISLESMPEPDRQYYKKLVDEVKKEAYKFNVDKAIPQDERLAKLLAEKQSAKSGLLPVEPKTETPSPQDKKTADAKPSEPINLDWTKWQKAFSEANEKVSTTEYGLKGEDVKNFKWTQLVTIQHFTKDEQKPVTAEEYFSAHLKPIEEMSKNTQKSFNKEIISQNANEIIYQWTFDGGKESEVARILNTDKGIVHYHYSKKGMISAEEKTKWVKTLKAAE